MAIKTRIVSSADGGLVDVVLTYDDVTGAVSTLALRNDGTNGSMTATLFDRTTHAVIFGPSTRTFGTGTVTQDISNLGLSMIPVTPNPKTAPDGWALPFAFSLAWSSA